MMQEDDCHNFREVRFLKQQLESFVQEKHSLAVTIKALQAENADQARRLNNLKEVNERMKRIYDRKETELCELMRTYKTKKGIKAGEKRELLEKLAEAQLEAEDQQHRIEALELLKRKLLEENEKLKAEVETTKANDMTEQLKAQYASLERSFEALKHESTALRAQCEHLKTENAQMAQKACESAKSVDFCAKLQLHKYFKGEIIDGLKSGLCEERDNNLSFKGVYVDGKRCGKGKLVADNITLTGTFDAGTLHGKGELLDCTTDKRMKGEFAHGQFAGTSFSIGRVRYNGCIVDNKAHGRGYFEFVDGFVFEGEFLNDEARENVPGVVYRPETGEEWSACFVGGVLRVDDLGVFSIDYASGLLKKVVIN